jgi:hypothetical protein
VRDTGKIFEFVNDIREIFNNINSFIPIYFGADIGIGDIEFSKKYKISAKRAGRKIMTDIKNSARPQSSNKRRKLIRL